MREWGLFSREKRRLRGTLAMCIDPQWGGVKTELNSVQGAQWQDQRQWTQLKHSRCHPNVRKHFLLWGWLNTGKGCPERLWSLHPWRDSKGIRTWSWATGSRWPCSEWGFGLGNLQSPAHKHSLNRNHCVIQWKCSPPGAKSFHQRFVHWSVRIRAGTARKRHKATFEPSVWVILGAWITHAHNNCFLLHHRAWNMVVPNPCKYHRRNKGSHAAKVRASSIPPAPLRRKWDSWDYGKHKQDGVWLRGGSLAIVYLFYPLIP